MKSFTSPLPPFIYHSYKLNRKEKECTETMSQILAAASQVGNDGTIFLKISFIYI